MLRKGATFKWTKQCKNAFKLLKSELVKMPALQYPNCTKQFKLFTDTSKHSYSVIIHHIEYFSGSFSKTQQLWNTTQKECYAIY